MMAEAFLGWHHLPNWKTIRPYGSGVAVNHYGGYWATFDFDRLTRLVFLAHDRCIRAEFEGSGPGLIRLVLHKRHSRDGRMSEKHPTIEQALSAWRLHHPKEQSHE